jgi:hypothetical protein
MYAVVKKSVTEIEVQAATRNYVFFFAVDERLTGVNWSSDDFNPLIAFVFVKSGGVFE